MTTEAHAAGGGRDALGATSGRAVALARLGIGLAQGIILYLLMRTTEGDGATWSSRNPELFAAMVLPALFLPPLLLASVGRLRPVTLAVWTGVAGALLAGLAWHNVARQSGADREPTFPLFAFSAVALFVAHHLILPADRARRPLAPYPVYFDAAWMAGVQLAASIAFAGAFWVLLFLGAALFNIIGLSFLRDLLEQGWFFLPLTGLAFATAVHLTDVREGLIRGVRTIALMLLSWLLVVLTVLVGGFLAALPFTGLDGLWATGSATALVLSAAGAMIVLINAAYQDGQPDNLPPAALRIAVRVASVLLIPLVTIAVWGLSLRIGQYGLTPDRVIALACAAVGAVYAGGYASAALRTLRGGGRWMASLEPTNVGAAVLVVAVILALFSPVADPARLSVADQMARLERGAISAEAFDYQFLRSESGKVGRAALSRLERSSNPDIARLAKEARLAADPNDWRVLEAEANLLTSADIKIAVKPDGTSLPASFLEQFERLLERLRACAGTDVCQARMVDLDRDGTLDVLVASNATIQVFKRESDGRWMEWAEYQRPHCLDEGALSEPFGEGRFETTPPRFPDLIVGGIRLRVEQGGAECPPGNP